jgi:hypothetical protein
MKTEQEFNDIFAIYNQVAPQGFAMSAEKVGTWRVERFKNLLHCVNNALRNDNYTRAYKAVSILIMFFTPCSQQ